MNRPKKLSALCTGTAALTLLIAFSAPHIRRAPPPAPDVRPVAASARNDRVLPSSEPQPASVGEKTAKAEPISTPPAEIDFEHQNLRDVTVISTLKVPPRDNPTPAPTTPQNTAVDAAQEPKMGDTRIVDGQPQVYFLGFGWIEDSDEPNVGIVVDGDGDINKMVGRMD